MLRSTIFSLCVLIAMACSPLVNPNPAPRTLLQVMWDIGVVDKEQADIAKKLGNDPLSLVELPKVTSWIKGMKGPDMSEVNLIIPSWFVLDGSGLRNGALFSVWCDHGDLFQDTLAVQDLKEVEGSATVEWAFDGESYARSLWTQKGQFVLPSDDFPHDAFVRQLATAKFLVLKVKGYAGLEDAMNNPKIRPENIAVIPVSLTGDNSALLELIEACSRSR